MRFPDVIVLARLGLGGFKGFRVAGWEWRGWSLAFMWKEEE